MVSFHEATARRRRQAGIPETPHPPPPSQLYKSTYYIIKYICVYKHLAHHNNRKVCYDIDQPMYLQIIFGT